MTEQQPQWQPLTLLPMFSEMVDGMLESSEEQLAAMQQVANKPHALDDATLSRVVKLYVEQLEDHWLFEEQFAHWKKETLNEKEAREVDRLVVQSATLKRVNEAILTIARSIEHLTIDKVMAMDETELAIKELSGEMKPPSFPA